MLSHANLRAAALTRATAIGARFRHARLEALLAAQANLMEANFESADLSGADLSRCDLRGAKLMQTRLSAAVLFGVANLAVGLAVVGVEAAVAH